MTSDEFKEELTAKLEVTRYSQSIAPTPTLTLTLTLTVGFCLPRGDALSCDAFLYHDASL